MSPTCGGQFFPASRSGKTSPWREAESDWVFLFSRALATLPTQKAVPFPMPLRAEDYTKSLKHQCLYHHSHPPILPTHPFLWLNHGRSSLPLMLSQVLKSEWVTWCKRKLMLAEDNKLAGTSRNPCWLTSYKSSRVLILKEIPKSSSWVGGMVFKNWGRLFWRCSQTNFKGIFKWQNHNHKSNRNKLFEGLFYTFPPTALFSF